MLSLEAINFQEAKSRLRAALRSAPSVKTERWQGVAANTDTIELRNVNFEIDLCRIEDLGCWQSDIEPNLPWADEHFLERVGGQPLNPGVQWAQWPWGQSANKFRASQGRFNHNYMERLWPKFARRTSDGSLPENGLRVRRYPSKDPRPIYGIGHHYGDLDDLVDLLAKEPHTRQAWIPLFFPEDTGLGDGGRKMCSLGYQVIVREDRAHLWYPLRSCDIIRHWQDDCYLAVRMLLWIIDQCRLRSDRWASILPGTYAMHMTSLHAFESDRSQL